MNLNFSDSAIRAIHRVMTRTRTLAYYNTDPQVLARNLDHADPLGFMLMNDFHPENGEDVPSLFRLHVQDMKNKFEGLSGLTTAFDRDMERNEYFEQTSQQPVRELAASSA